MREMLAMVDGAMEKFFDFMLHIENISDKHVDTNANRLNDFAFRARQDNFTIHDFNWERFMAMVLTQRCLVMNSNGSDIAQMKMMLQSLHKLGMVISSETDVEEEVDAAVVQKYNLS
ncbi:hypothetical protein L2E82_21061 [Cichorium intybus]|uniref:Uncharacterized protein n=1 Tax=Cichorium intybus TaxID=13427 RepID=A0ACB9DVD9_CICIN|nr:hypothetical protein L2E82_21061 [Cichorium intybus]